MEPQFSHVTQQAKHLGKRLTVQRRAVLLYMLNAVTPQTAKDVYFALREEMPNITLSTVYTALRFFVKLGLIKEHANQGASRFECLVPANAALLSKFI
jgi:Fur family peroxide stress response transcriptional regulator